MFIFFNVPFVSPINTEVIISILCAPAFLAREFKRNIQKYTQVMTVKHRPCVSSSLEKLKPFFQWT